MTDTTAIKAWAEKRRKVLPLPETLGLSGGEMLARSKASVATQADRERQRVEILVLGGKRPAPLRTVTRRQGKRRVMQTAVRLEPGIETELAKREAWSHKQGTPQTMAYFQRCHTGSLAQLAENGVIDGQQLAAAEEIRAAAEALVHDVSIGTAGYTPRMDGSGARTSDLIIEGLAEARRSVAYSAWREAIPMPRQAIFDMLIGQPVGYSIVAKRYGMDHRRARGLLIKALDLWQVCMDDASRFVTFAALKDAHASLA